MILTAGRIALLVLTGLTMAFMLENCHRQPYEQGQVLYTYYCSNCHMEDGSGLGRLIPPLTTSGLRLSDPASLVCLIRKGLPRNPQTGQQMPENVALSDAEMTNLINFLGLKYGDKSQTVQIQEVQKWMEACQSQ